MKTKEELEEAIKDTITMYKENFFSSDTPVCIACLDKLWKQQVIDQHVYDQTLDGRHGEKTRMGRTSKKYCDEWLYDDR